MNADEWNKHFPTGTRVHWVLGNGDVLPTKTTGPASVLESGLNVVPLADSAHVVLLNRVRPAQPAKKGPDGQGS